MREALVAALGQYLHHPGSYTNEQWNAVGIRTDAAHKYLAQLPEKCAICNGDGFITYGDDGNARDCEICHGSGKVYPPELVERIAKIFYNSDVEAVASRGGSPVPWQRVISEAPRSPWHLAAVAVLDALNGTADG